MPKIGPVNNSINLHPPIQEIAKFLSDYIHLPDSSTLVIASWVQAAWLIDVWDRFPHLAITSPEKRCGKTTLLETLSTVVPKPRSSPNISPSVMYRVIQQERPTLLMDEAQSVVRQGSEASTVMREILNAGISKNGEILRCGGKNWEEIRSYAIYSPKVFAMIGPLDGVLADRCFPILMRRKTKDVVKERYRERVVSARGAKIKEKMEKWATANLEKVQETYDSLSPFDIENDRMAELLLPLQSVLEFSACKEEDLCTIYRYAVSLDDMGKEQESQSNGVRMLKACKDLFKDEEFIFTHTLLSALLLRGEEPWYRLGRGEKPLGSEALANLLRPYGIASEKEPGNSGRKGYYSSSFKDAWSRYLAE